MFSTLAAMLACYGTIALVGILSIMGISLVVNPVVQASSISILALLAALLIVLHLKRARSLGPALVAIAGAAVILWVMWGTYNWMLELGGFVAILCAAYWDWRLCKSCAV